MPVFTSNYPAYQHGKSNLPSTPDRVGALPEFTGRGVVMAFIDAGFYPHPDLRDHIRLHVDATTAAIVETTDPDKIPVVPGSWHGQMTSFIACGNGSISNGKYRGIASDAEMVLIKVTSPKGHIKEADILRGVKWLLENHRKHNIRIVNISVGGDHPSDKPDHELHAAVRQLTEEGVMVLVAAGNNPDRRMVPPASAAEALTVGGYDDGNTPDSAKWAGYHHSFGKTYTGAAKPEILAPAAWIASPFMPETDIAREAHSLATLLHLHDSTTLRRYLMEHWNILNIPRRQARRPDANLYAELQKKIDKYKVVDALHQHVDGTSVAAPIVASVIAQMLEACPNLTPAQIRSILTATAQRLPQISVERQGAGVLNAAAAVQAALET